MVRKPYSYLQYSHSVVRVTCCPFPLPCLCHLTRYTNGMTEACALTSIRIFLSECLLHKRWREFHSGSLLDKVDHAISTKCTESDGLHLATYRTCTFIVALIFCTRTLYEQRHTTEPQDIMLCCAYISVKGLLICVILCEILWLAVRESEQSLPPTLLLVEAVVFCCHTDSWQAECTSFPRSLISSVCEESWLSAKNVLYVEWIHVMRRFCFVSVFDNGWSWVACMEVQKCMACGITTQPIV